MQKKWAEYSFPHISARAALCCVWTFPSVFLYITLHHQNSFLSNNKLSIFQNSHFITLSDNLLTNTICVISVKSISFTFYQYLF